MAGSSAITVVKATGNTSSPVTLKWRLATTAGGWYANANGKDKVIFLIAAESTTPAAGTTFYIGTSDTATTRSAAAALFSGAALNRMKVKVGKTTKGSSYARFRSTATTKLMHIVAAGPYETARFKDSDGYINLAKAKQGSTRALVAAIFVD